MGIGRDLGVGTLEQNRTMILLVVLFVLYMTWLPVAPTKRKQTDKTIFLYVWLFGAKIGQIKNF